MSASLPTLTIATYIEDELQRARSAWDQFADAVYDQALQQQRNVKLPAQRSEADELARLLKENRAFMAVAYQDALKSQVRRTPRAPQPPRPGAQRPQRQVLELVDLDSIALDVELARVIQAVRDEAEPELIELQAYLATLVGDAAIEEDHNPFHPAAHGRALRAAAQMIRGTLTQRLAFVRIAAKPFARSMRQAYAEACLRLEEAGVEPATHRCIVNPDGTRQLQILSDLAVAPDLRRMRDALPPIRRGAAARARGASADFGGVRLTDTTRSGVAPRAHQVPRQAPLQEGHAQVRDQSAAPDTEVVREHGAARVSEASRAPFPTEATLDPADRRAVDLVNRLFKAFPLDERVPDDVRQIIARLRAPALRLTLRDASVLDQRAHPLWKFIHLFAYQAEMLPKADDPERRRWLDFGRRTVEELAGASVQKTVAYQSALEDVERFLRERLAKRCTALAARFQALQATEAGLAATQAGATSGSSSLNATLAAMLPRAELGRESAAGARLSAEEWFNGLVPGQWLRLLLLGNWVHAQLLWQGDRRQIVLLGDGPTDTTWALRRSVLLKMHMHGLAKTLQMRSLVGTAAMRVQEQIAVAAVA